MMRSTHVLKISQFAAGAVLLLGAGQLSAAEIAGLNPSERPKDAPVITAYVKDGAWYTKALQSISKPYPMSLRFLDDQGAWFTPFNHSGMLGPYDIRGLHGSDQTTQ